MKRSLVRTTATVGLCVIVALLFTQYVYRTKKFNSTYADNEIPYGKQQKDSIDKNQYLIKVSQDEKFFSFFPHG